MNTEQVHAFRASLKRCLSTPDFLRTFYDLFMGFSEEIRAKFRQTDFTRQTRVLADSLYAMAVVGQGERDSPTWAEIERLGRQHARDQLDIRPELYDIWLDCLVKAARQYDSQFTPELERARRCAPASITCGRASEEFADVCVCPGIRGDLGPRPGYRDAPLADRP